MGKGRKQEKQRQHKNNQPEIKIIKGKQYRKIQAPESCNHFCDYLWERIE